MIKYLDMENASLELDLDTIADYKDFIELNASSIIDLNIKRVTFKVNEAYLEEMIEYVKSAFEDSNILIILESFLTENLSYELPDNIMIFNNNIRNLNIIKGNIYQSIDLTKDNIELISKLINDNQNVVVNPVIDAKHINDFMDSLNDLFNKVSSKDVNLGGFLIPSALMKEHPCNAYLCNGFKCMNKVSTLPKVLFIDKNYDIYPHKLIYSNLKIGDVKNINIQEVLSNYLNSDNHQRFINYCKKVFVKYLANYPYDFMPIISYIELELDNNE